MIKYESACDWYAFQTVNAAMAVYDVDGQGSLEMNEFLQFLRFQCLLCHMNVFRVDKFYD